MARQWGKFGGVLIAAMALTAAAAGSAPATSTSTSTPASRTAPAAAPASVKVMTWNVCANSKPHKDERGQKVCASGRRTSRVAAGIRWHMRQHPGLDAVLLQEICYADVHKLRGMDGLKGWKFGFAALKDRGHGATRSNKIVKRRCAGGRGQFGVAVGVKASRASFHRYHYAARNVPNARDVWGHWNVHQTGVCADANGTRYCGTHFTPWKGGHRHWSQKQASEFLTSQYGQAKELAQKGAGHRRVVMGGDLNSSPKRTSSVTGPMLDPLYTKYKECGQDAAGGARTGTGTYQTSKGTRGAKLDYLFTNRSARASCQVPLQHITLSDHVPVTATVTF